MSLVRASIWLLLAEMAFAISGYIVHSVLGRVLGPADYGRYALAITLSTMVVVLIGRGVPISMSKYLSEIFKKDKNQIPIIRKNALAVQLILIVVVTTLYFLLAPVFATLLNDPTLTPLFQLSSLIIPAFALASFYVYYFVGIQQFQKQAFLKFFRSFAKVVFIIPLAVIFAVPGAVVGHFLAPLAVFIVAFIADPYKKLKSKNIQSKSEITWKKLIKFAWPITLFMIFFEIMISIDLFMVKGILQDDSLTGFYNAAITLARIPFYLFYFLTLILLPKISETTSQGLNKETKNLMNKSMRFLFMLLIPFVFLLSAFAPSAVLFFYGENFIPAYLPMQILAFGVGFLTVFYALAFVLNGAGKNRIPMWITFSGMVTNTILGFFLIQQYGIMGAAVATSITSLLVMFVIIYFSQKNVAKFINYIKLLKYFLASIVIYFIAISFLPQGKFMFILWGGILFAVYLLFLYIFKEIKQEDWTMFRDSLKKKTSK